MVGQIKTKNKRVIYNNKETIFENGIFPGDGLHISTSFPDISTANKATKETLIHNADVITKWLNEENSKNIILVEHELTEVIGYGIIDSKEINNLYKVYVFLEKISNPEEPFAVKTTFPVTRIGSEHNAGGLRKLLGWLCCNSECNLKWIRKSYPLLFGWFCCLGADADSEQFNLEATIYNHFNYKNIGKEKEACLEIERLIEHEPFPEELVSMITNRSNNMVNRREWLDFFKNLLGTRIATEELNLAMSNKKWATVMAAQQDEI